MADKDKLTRRQQQMIDRAFKDVETVSVDTDFGKIRLISLEEVPMTQMKRFMRAPHEERMSYMMDFMKVCLIDPNDWDKISSLPIKKFNVIVQSWMSGSEQNNNNKE